MENIVFISGKRTPFGAFGGSLKDISATDLTVHSGKAAMQQGGIKPEHVDHVVIGNVVQSGVDAAYLARHVGLKAGLPTAVPAYIVNRLCGSGFQAWVNASQMIHCGEAQLVLAGGAEQMSQIPYVLRNVRFGGIRMGAGELEDYMTSALTDQYTKTPMAITAENLGEKYEITRDQVDEYSILSQARFKAALDRKIFDQEIEAITIDSKKGPVKVEKDEHPKPEVTLEKIKAMKPLFKKEGLVTAATASGIVDGAACSLITSESYAKKAGLIPLAKIVGYASAGCEPSIMGIGPVMAIRNVLQKTGLALKDVDFFEVNEAFAAQYLAVEKELGLPRDRTNVNGGAIAVGHPLGASGTRIMNHLVYQLQQTGSRRAIGAACIGGGQGIAIMIEKI
jgi:acetyl-CoA C-acetyltransferase/acetyl-CoA acyltransferase 2